MNMYLMNDFIIAINILELFISIKVTVKTNDSSIII